jgi:cytoskeletal protein RodZ
MVAHRKNVPAPRAFVPSSWFIVLTVMVVIGGAGWLGWLVLDDDPTTSDVATGGPVPSASASPTPTPTPAEQSPTPTGETSEPADETPAPDEEPPAPPEADEESPEPADETPARTATVSVLNNSGIVGAARAFSAKVTGTGWPLGGIGNWTGSIGANTVYYPPGLQAQGELLARDVGIARVRPSVSPMRSDRLTIILSGTS